MVRALILTGVFCLLSIVSGCAQGTRTERPVVVSTTSMIHDLVQTIGGPDVTAIGLMGPGVDPHGYKATEGDVRTLASADVIFYNGLHLEAKLGDVFEKMGQSKRVVAVSEAIPTAQLRMPSEFKGFPDPHIWFDVALWKIAAKTVATTLSEADPKNKTHYMNRYTTYLRSLDQLDQDIRAAVQRIPTENRVLVTAHDAFGYFGKAYGIRVMGLQGISTQSEPGIHDVKQLARFVSDHRIPSIFIESAIPARTIQSVQQACKANGWTVRIGGQLYADAVGSAGTSANSTIGMMRANMATIVEGLAR